MEVKGYEGYYYIFDNGMISNGSKFLKPQLSGPKGNQYLNILSKKNAEGKRKHLKIHRLVAEAYIPNPLGLPCVDHKDRNKLNNDYRNLRWVNHSQNNFNRVCPNKLGEKHIYFHTNKGQNMGYYQVCINLPDKTRLRKNGFKTIEEAIAWRDSNL